MARRDLPEPEDDCVERLLMRWGLAGFAIGLAVVCAFIFCISHRIASFIYPGA